MDNFTISLPYILFLLFLIPVLFYFLYSRYKIRWFSGEFYEDIKKVYKTHSILYKLYVLLICFIFWVYIFLLSDPRINYSKKEKPKNWIDIAIVLDVSYSMEAKDISPNRIEAAKTVLANFFGKIQGDRISLVLFSWRPFSSIPLTFDYPFLVQFINSSSTSIINQSVAELQGTALWDAMILATAGLFPENEKDDKKREKVMILLTDWEANKWIDPSLSLKFLKEKWVKVYTIWVWWKEKTFVQLMDSFGRISNVEVWPVDETMLKKISAETWWKYFKASDNDTFENIFNTISQLEKREIIVESTEVKAPFYDLFIIILLLSHVWVFYMYFRNIKL